MTKFTGADDHEMRVEILSHLPHIIGRAEITEFAVVRTNDRKGYRHERAFANNSPYQDDPKVRVRIEFEVVDDVTPGFECVVSQIITCERVAAQLAASKRIAEAADRLSAAQREYKDAIADHSDLPN